MKRNNLTTAILAGITGIAGIASVSNAVNLNTDGLGQVLIFPYYTVNNGLNTLISVVNTTDKTKAVKVRFLEGKNSRECLDFNVYMSPYDVWTAALVPATSTAFFNPTHPNEPTVKIVTFDNTCVDPAINGFEFLPFAFDVATGYDGIGRTLDRCLEGHFEMIDMGDITDVPTQAGVKHGATGFPANCGVIATNFATGGLWGSAATVNDGIAASSGGLFGSASLIDVTGGVDVSYNADAIEGFTTNPLHSTSGDLTPSLNSGNVQTSNIFNNATVVSDMWLSGPVQAVSAVYMHDNIYGEYVLSTPTFAANTEWVVTFPTKNFYVDQARAFTANVPPASAGTAGGVVPIAPFTKAISPTGACEVYTFNYYDREEQDPDPRLIPRPPSPRPPGTSSSDAVFCWETNVVEFENTERTSGNSMILGSNNTTHLITQSVPGQAATPTTPAVDAAYFSTGWVAINFAQSTNDVAPIGAAAARTYNGLPVTGFAIQRYTNSNLDGGILANYAGLFAHRYSRTIN